MGSHKNTTQGKGHKGKRSAQHSFTKKYERQRVRTEANRKRRRVRHLALHPSDIQTLAALKKKL